MRNIFKRFRRNDIIQKNGGKHEKYLEKHETLISILLIIIYVNLWTGININNTTSEIIFFMLSMIFVGFLEEIIFRGFLFKMMEKDNVNRAVIVSSLTFGIGHIVNLLNGAELVSTLIQICYAVAAGYLFVTIFQKRKKLMALHHNT